MITNLNQLTRKRREALIAAYECDSVTNSSNARSGMGFTTQTLNWLRNRDLLAAFDIRELYRGSGKYQTVTWYTLTEQGKALVGKYHAANGAQS